MERTAVIELKRYLKELNPEPSNAASIETRTPDSIKIKVKITGDENLLAEGSVEGSINLSEFDLTIGQSGDVTAEVRAKTVKVEGQVTGDIHASQNVLRFSASACCFIEFVLDRDGLSK